MIQDFTLHTHTNEFDGQNSINEMINRAADMEMSAIGISNHFIAHPVIRQTNFYPFAVRGGYESMYSTSFDELMAQFVPHFENIERIGGRQNIRVLRGVEADFFYYPTWERDFARAMDVLRPDYIIGACHFIEMDGKLYNIHDIANATPAMRDRMLELYWAKVRDAAASGIFTWMAHLDLPKRVGAGMGARWVNDEMRAIETLARHNMPIELNTAGKINHSAMHPGERVLDMVRDANIPVLISDDAHAASQIGRGFDAATRALNAHGIKNRMSLQKILDFSKKSR